MISLVFFVAVGAAGLKGTWWLRHPASSNVARATLTCSFSSVSMLSTRSAEPKWRISATAGRTLDCAAMNTAGAVVE